MPDVHRLRDVGRGEVNHDSLASAGGGHAEAWVADERCGVRGVGGGKDAEIDESRTGDVGGGESREVEVIDDFLGECARVGLALFGEDHGGIRLVVAKAEVSGGSDCGGGWLAKSGGERGGKAGFEFLKKRHENAGGGRGRNQVPTRAGLESRIDKISSQVSEAASRRRTSRLVNILAIAASVCK